MKTTMTFTLTMAVCLALATATFAGDKKNNSGQKKKFNSFIRNQSASQFLPNQSQGNLDAKFSKKKSKKHNQNQDQRPVTTTVNDLIGNGRPQGDGRVPVTPTKPGYVWTGTHWERERAPTSPFNPPPVTTSGQGGVTVTPGNNVKPQGGTSKPVRPSRPGYVWTGTHWERERAPVSTSNPPPVTSSGQGGVTVTPGNNVKPQGGTSKPVRPSRPGYVWTGTHWERERAPVSPFNPPPVASSGQGGVTVTPTQNSSRNNTIPTYGGPGPLELLGKGASKVGSTVKDLFTTEVGSMPTVRDHRTPATSNFGPNVRDHRTPATSNFGPNVRDHRQTASDTSNFGPNVRDHRN